MPAKVLSDTRDTAMAQDDKKMRKLRRLRNRKAVSTVVAVLLMIAIAVAASVLVYVWSMTLVGSLQTGGGQQTKEQIELDAYTWKQGQPLTLHLRNVGTVILVVDAIYVEGVTISSSMNSQISVGQVKDISLTMPGTISYVGNVEYTIKIVTQSGGVFSFPCIYGHGA
jgi:FlaG/FlaF family flagellin (archaellin)